MRYMSKTEYESRMKRARAKSITVWRKQELKKEINKYKIKPKLPTWSKMLAVYLFAILNVVLCYAMIAMWHFSDLSYLGVLITDIAGQVLIYFIYAKKSIVENTVGGITYDMAMKTIETKYDERNEETTVSEDNNDTVG